jgi:hypothetical protein
MLLLGGMTLALILIFVGLCTSTPTDQMEWNEGPNIKFIYDGAPDALVWEICDINILSERTVVLTTGMYSALRLNDSWTFSIFFPWYELKTLSDTRGCITVSQDPTKLSEGPATAQVYICDEAHNCNFGFDSQEIMVVIRQNPFKVHFFESATNFGSVDRIMNNGSCLLEYQWPVLEDEQRLPRTSFCDVVAWREKPPAARKRRICHKEGTTVDTLIIYAFSQSDEGWREDNFLFWLAKGLVLHDRYHFVVIVSGDLDDAWRQILDRIAAASPAFEWHSRRNYGRDACAWHAVLRGWICIRRALDTFARFVILNASCRGPFLPTYYRQPWPEAFLSLLTRGVVLAGPSVFCACARPEPSPGFPCIATPQLHVQSYLLAFSGAALGEVAELLRAICAPTGEGGEGGLHAWSFEMDLTRRVVAAGGGVAALQYLWTGADLRDAAAAAQLCAFAVTPGGTGDTLHTNAYAGGDVHPLETVFFKTNRGVAEEALRRLTRAALAAPPRAVPRHVLCGPG